MNRTGAFLMSVLAAGAFAATVWAQTAPEIVPPGAPIPPGAIVNGNKILVPEPARLSDAELNRHRAWHEFADAHPEIVADLAKHPKLVGNRGYGKKHPDFDQFLAAHPDIRQAMIANPGNFIVPVR